jgi:hypothetical protein
VSGLARIDPEALLAAQALQPKNEAQIFVG